jgi:hypothetical protein
MVTCGMAAAKNIDCKTISEIFRLHKKMLLVNYTLRKIVLNVFPLFNLNIELYCISKPYLKLVIFCSLKLKFVLNSAISIKQKANSFDPNQLLNGLVNDLIKHSLRLKLEKWSWPENWNGIQKYLFLFYGIAFAV